MSIAEIKTITIWEWWEFNVEKIKEEIQELEELLNNGQYELTEKVIIEWIKSRKRILKDQVSEPMRELNQHLNDVIEWGDLFLKIIWAPARNKKT